MTEQAVVASAGVKDRLRAAFDEMLEVADIPGPLLSLGRGMFENFLNNSSEAQIIETLNILQESLIPFILYGDTHEE